MRIIILRDNIINHEEFDKVIDDFKKLFKNHAGMDLNIYVEDYDFSDTPYSEYRPGLRGIDRNYLAKVSGDIVDRFGKRRFDHVVFMVDAKHWVPASDNIWGWNITYAFAGLENQQVRFDSVSQERNSRIANTLGTLYHETMHATDQFVYRLTGEDIAKVLNVKDFDDDFVHGGDKRFSYIRHKENVDGLAEISPYLRNAYSKREVRHYSDHFTKGLNVAIKHRVPFSVIQDLIEVFRKFINGLTKQDKPWKI